MKNLVLIALTIGYWLLHQDLWNWRAARPLAFGFLPPALSYHALYTIGIAALMVLLVKTAWPHELEREVESD